MKIEKLLFVTKFEELGFDAVRSLLSLTKADLNHVVFINVIERDRFAMSRVGYRKDEEIRLREAANIRFIDWSENLFEQGLEVGVDVDRAAIGQAAEAQHEPEEHDACGAGLAGHDPPDQSGDGASDGARGLGHRGFQSLAHAARLHFGCRRGVVSDHARPATALAQ